MLQRYKYCTILLVECVWVVEAKQRSSVISSNCGLRFCLFACVAISLFFENLETKYLTGCFLFRRHEKAKRKGRSPDRSWQKWNRMTSGARLFWIVGSHESKKITRGAQAAVKNIFFGVRVKKKLSERKRRIIMIRCFNKIQYIWSNDKQNKRSVKLGELKRRMIKFFIAWRKLGELKNAR